VLALLAGVALVLLGAGLLNTLIPLRGNALGFSDTLLGTLTSAYYIGFLLGTFAAPVLIRRVGHIRAFALYAAASACCILLHALGDSAVLWLALRLAIGVLLVGLYTVIESWLNAQAEAAERGRVFAIYMIVNLASLACAQQLLHFGADLARESFVLAALLVCASMLPVLWTGQSQPSLLVMPKLRLRGFFATAPTAGTAALLTGLAMGSFWGLLPLYGADQGLSRDAVATMMSAAIFGGAALQWPLGRLSDRHDRRLTLASIGAAGCVLAAIVPVTGATGWAGNGVIFLYGGIAFAVYLIAVAHLIDHLPREEVVVASSGVLLVYGLGSAIGPLLSASAMDHFGPDSLFVWFALMHGMLACLALYRYHVFRREQPREAHFAPMLRTTPASLEMLGPASPEHSTLHD
jgi:MFS family permease